MKHTSPLLILLLSFFMLLCTVVQAQENKWPIINGEFKNLTASRFINQLETQTAYHFYYDSTGLDSLKVNMNIQGEPITGVLDKAFANTDYRYAIYHTAVFITRGTNISTALPDDFFAGKNTGADPAAAPGDMLTEAEEENKPQSASLESKLYEIGIKTSG